MGLTQTQVSQLYVSLFGRASEGSGSAYWMNSQADMALAGETMLATDAAKQYFGNSLNTDQAFIEYIYENTFGKTYGQDEQGVDYWVNALESGMSRGQVIAALIEAAQNPENAGAAQDQFNNKVVVSNYVADMIYTFSDMSTFSGFVSDVDDSAQSVQTAMERVDTLNASAIFTLTKDVDLFDGTSGNDVFTAPSGTLGMDDNLIDIYSSDDDILHLSLPKDMNGVNEPVIQKIETINVTYDHLAGAVTAFDATNVVEANINMLIGRAIDGTGTVVDAGMNSVTAGAGIETLVVTNISNGVVYCGNASNVIVDDDAQVDSSRIIITVNGDLNLNATTETQGRFTVDAKAELTIDLDSSEAGTSSFSSGTNIIFGGDFGILVKNAELLDGLTTLDQTGLGELVADIGGTVSVDAGAWSFDRIVVSSDLSSAGAATLSVKNNDILVLGNSQTATTILENEDSTTSAIINVSTGENQTMLIFNSTMGNAASTLVNLAVTSNIILGEVTDTGGEGELVITGADKVTIGWSDFAYVNALALTGEFDFTAGGNAYVTGSATHANTIDVSTFDIIFQGGGSADSVDGCMAETSTLITALEDGDDTLFIDDSLASARVTVDFGGGTDTLWLGNGTELSGVTVGNLAGATQSIHSWSNLEKIELENISNQIDTVQVTVNGSDISGKSIEIFTSDADDIAEFGVYADASTLDLSNLSFSLIDTVFIRGSGEKGATIMASSVNDTIDTGNGNVAAKVTITTGAGDDTIVVDHLGSGVSAGDIFDNKNIVTITDYQAAEEILDNDTIDLKSLTSILGNITLEDGLSLAGATTQIETGALNAVVTDGILTLDGSDTDKLNMDTLAEWVAAASMALDRDDTVDANYDVVAFEFNSNTYVVVHDDTGGATEDAVMDNVIELAGITGITAVSHTAGLNTILISQIKSETI